MRVVGLVLVAASLVHSSAESAAPTKESIIQASRGACYGEVIQALVDFGPENARAIAEAWVPGQIGHLALQAIARLKEPSASEALHAHLEAMTATRRARLVEWQKASTDRPSGAASGADVYCIRALRHCRGRNAVGLLVDIMREGPALRESDPSEICVPLEAAAAVAVLGDDDQRQEAVEFILTVRDEGATTGKVGWPLNSESIYKSLIVALSQVGTDEALDYVARRIGSGMRLPEDLFLSLPRDAGHAGLVEALFLRLVGPARCEPGNPATLMAALVALSEMGLTPQIVPVPFWQEYWDDFRLHLVRTSTALPCPDSIAYEMLTDRHRTFLKRMNIQWDHGDKSRTWQYSQVSRFRSKPWDCDGYVDWFDENPE